LTVSSTEPVREQFRSSPHASLEASREIEDEDISSPSERSDSLEPLVSDLPDFIIVDRGVEDEEQNEPATRTVSAPGCLGGFQLETVDEQPEDSKGEDIRWQDSAGDAKEDKATPPCKQAARRRDKPCACKYHNRSPISYRSSQTPSPPPTALIQVRSLTAEMKKF